MKRPKKPGEVSIAELKAKLSGFLRKVRAGGTFVVTDHGAPVARVVPVESEELALIPAKYPFRDLRDSIRYIPAKPQSGEPDAEDVPLSLQLLLEDRRKR